MSIHHYDTQRFGVPGGPKRTHLIGSAILTRRWDDALRELAGAGAPESAGARDWVGSAQGFFDQLDRRTASFYLAAHASHEWNGALRSQVEEACPDQYSTVAVDGIEYSYVTAPAATTLVLAKALWLPYARYHYVNGAPVATPSARTTVVQMVVAADPVRADQEIAGKFSLCLRFFLPSGCYATAAIRQLLAYR